MKNDSIWEIKHGPEQVKKFNTDQKGVKQSEIKYWPEKFREMIKYGLESFRKKLHMYQKVLGK